MSEWLKEHAWKACVRETVPRVRIPLSPPLKFSRSLRTTFSFLKIKGVCLLNFIIKLNKFIAERMFFVTLSALLLGFFFSIPDGVPHGKIVSIALFAILTFFATTSLNIEEFFLVLKNPVIPLWLLLLVHVGTPVIAYFLGNLFYADNNALRLGVLIGAILPMGVSTIVWTSLLGGDLAISIVAITLDTLVAPMLIPVFIALFFGKTVQLDYFSMVSELIIMVSIPGFLGMIVNKKLSTKPILLSRINVFGNLTAKICMFLVIYLNSAVVMPRIEWNIETMWLMLFMLLMVLSAFGLGYLGAIPIKNLSRPLFISIVYNVGMRNINFGMVLAIAYFPPEVAIPATLMIVFQQPVAAIVGYFINQYYPDKAV